jgi:hypothetical protein
MKLEHAVKILKRRAEHLSEKLDKDPGRSYDAAEMDAIEMVIEFIEEHIDEDDKKYNK